MKPQIRILLFGRLKEVFQTAELTGDRFLGLSIGEMVRSLGLQGPLVVAINQSQVGPLETIKAGDEVALMPPASGG